MSTEDITKMEEGEVAQFNDSAKFDPSAPVLLAQKVVAEVLGTYFIVFSGCCSVVLEKKYGNITFPGICLVWGCIVTIMIYSVGHISGAHFNPAVTVTMTLLGKFPLKEVPYYVVAHVTGSFLASGSLYLLFDTNAHTFFGTVPAGSDIQSLIFEIITTFLLLFSASALGDTKAFGKFGGIVVGLVIVVDVYIAGPVSGASMNPARTLGPAVVMGIYKGIWVYIVGPFVGAILGALVYTVISMKRKLNK